MFKLKYKIDYQTIIKILKYIYHFLLNFASFIFPIYLLNAPYKYNNGFLLFFIPATIDPNIFRLIIANIIPNVPMIGLKGYPIFSS